MDIKDYYKILQVDPSAEPEVITAAYKRLAVKYHPDTNKDPESNLKMQEINAAYQVLSDSSKRAEYDLLQSKKKNQSKNKAPNQGTRERKLLHQSDFWASSSYWKEDTAKDSNRFTKNGYYHIALMEDGKVFNYIPIYVKDFRLYVDIQISEASEPGVYFGVVFRASADNEGNTTFYDLWISDTAAGLEFTQNDQEEELATWINSPHIYGAFTLFSMDWEKYSEKQEDGWNLTNRFMVEAKGDLITIGANKKILGRVNNKSLKAGYVGVYVMLFQGPYQGRKYGEARFRNFRLYSVED